MSSLAGTAATGDQADQKLGHLTEKSPSTDLGESHSLHLHDQGYSPEEEKRVLRKIDLLVLPMVRTQSRTMHVYVLINVWVDVSRVLFPVS